VRRYLFAEFFIIGQGFRDDAFVGLRLHRVEDFLAEGELDLKASTEPDSSIRSRQGLYRRPAIRGNILYSITRPVAAHEVVGQAASPSSLTCCNIRRKEGLGTRI
jgi:hypothetical protein